MAAHKLNVPPPPGADWREFTDLYRAYLPTVARWTNRLAGQALDVEDLLQEIFLIVHRRLPTYRGDSTFPTWLYGITANVVRDRRRKERLRRWLAGMPREFAGRIPSGQPSPVEELERREARDLVYRALDRIGDKYRTVYILFELEGLTGEEISVLTGVKVATVRVRMHRARARFLDALGALKELQ